MATDSRHSNLPPALGFLELDSVAIGIYTSDAMVKSSPVEPTFVGTTHPGNFLILVSGDVASVEEAMTTGMQAGKHRILDHIMLPDAHPRLQSAVRQFDRYDHSGDALGVVETKTVAAVLGAADRGLKGAAVSLSELRLADDLGGKAYCCFLGEVSEVEEAVQLAVKGLAEPSMLIEQTVIPRLDGQIRTNLSASPLFRSQPHSVVGSGGNS